MNISTTEQDTHLRQLSASSGSLFKGSLYHHKLPDGILLKNTLVKNSLLKNTFVKNTLVKNSLLKNTFVKNTPVKTSLKASGSSDYQVTNHHPLGFPESLKST